MLHDYQLGLPVAESKGKLGIRWVRMTTNIPALFLGLLGGCLDFKSYLRSLKTCDVVKATQSRLT
jgi:hypothetical protein